MRMTPIQLHKNKLMTQYRNHDEAILSYFEYAPFSSLKNRLDYLSKQNYKRDDLVDVLQASNERWGAAKETFEQIKRLKDESSVVVIGGQQAGLLTGPLYSVNKVISVLQYAKKQEAELQVPVIPVFWIAGEDHDYNEINHTYMEKDGDLIKHTIKQHVNKKESVSHIDLDKEALHDWVYDILRSLDETIHTKEIAQMIDQAIAESKTYVDFFARLIHQLFKGSGLVLIDSADDALRALETDMFESLINKQAELAQSVYETTAQLQQKGYPIDLDVSLEDGHLFYHDHLNERILLEHREDGWYGKQDEVKLSREDLLACAKASPQKLSNNVVSRPLMQDYLFPTLAFIAGDGEISYWATLKGAFRALDMEMPPVIPRLSFTYVTTQVEKRLEDRQLSAEEVIQNGATEKKFAWLMAQNDPPIHLVIENVLEAMRQAHAPIRKWAQDFADDLGRLAEKNLAKIEENVRFMERRMEGAVQEKYKLQLDAYRLVENMLHPRHGLQERVWSPIVLLNELGGDWIQSMLTAELSEENNHYIIYLG